MVDGQSKLEKLGFDVISPGDSAGLEIVLHRNHWIDKSESVVDVGLAGEGNMNCTLRVSVKSPDGIARSLIVKQSRPWVEKYPAIAAPVDRALFELQFYHHVASFNDISSQMPKLIGGDPKNYALCLQDISGASDMTDAYQNATLPIEEASRWISRLHAIEIENDDEERFRNISLRQINHEHIFVIPFAESIPVDLDAITSGLEACRRELVCNDFVRRTAAELGNQYLHSLGGDKTQRRLLHGDYYPGSFLRQRSMDVDLADKFFVIDPEFCFVGPPEFDLGVLLAHAVFCGHAPDDAIEEIASHYSDSAQLDQGLWVGFAAIEILRRLLGVAQLPIDVDLVQKREWIELARAWILPR